jgi:hypothetical protein
MTTPKSRSLVSLRAAARKVGQSVATVRRRVKTPASGFPIPVNINNQWFFYADELDRYIASRPGITEKPIAKAAALIKHAAVAR